MASAWGVTVELRLNDRDDFPSEIMVPLAGPLLVAKGEKFNEVTTMVLLADSAAQVTGAILLAVGSLRPTRRWVRKPAVAWRLLPAAGTASVGISAAGTF